jgi:hypothetical protein
VPSASDLTPNPTVVYPTKILEYMACKRAIVAPKRETVQLVVENGREALLFEPGDPIDLARKVLRLLGEPILRERLAAAAYERVRRDFTASATRRALRKAYDVVAQRFPLDSEQPEDDSPKIEILSDDDFEATVFEEAPQAPPVDTALTRIPGEDDALVDLDHGGNTSSESLAAPPPPHDVTQERSPVAPARAESVWTTSSLVAPPPPAGSGQDDWVVTSVAQAVRPISEGDSEHDTPGPANDDGTPVEGTAPPPPPAPTPHTESAFVAGEIDVPTPGPDNKPTVEFAAAGKMLGGSEPSDPDTGSRTPPLERRS